MYGYLKTIIIPITFAASSATFAIIRPVRRRLRFFLAASDSGEGSDELLPAAAGVGGIGRETGVTDCETGAAVVIETLREAVVCGWIETACCGAGAV